MLGSKILVLLFIFAPYAQGSTAAVGSNVKGVLDQLVSAIRGNKGFSTAGCPKIPPEKWAKLLLFNQPVQHELQFSKGCDLQGTLILKQNQFPFDLAVRNVGEANRIQAQVEPVIEPDLLGGEIQVTIRTLGGSVYKAAAEKIMGFSSTYKLVTTLDGKMKKNLGGEVLVNEFHGVHTQIKEKIKIE